MSHLAISEAPRNEATPCAACGECACAEAPECGCCDCVTEREWAAEARRKERIDRLDADSGYVFDRAELAEWVDAALERELCAARVQPLRQEQPS